jgi:hypothetical protein
MGKTVYLIWQITYYDTDIYIVAADDKRDAIRLIKTKHPDFHKYYMFTVLPNVYYYGTSGILFDKNDEEDEMGEDEEYESSHYY